MSKEEEIFDLKGVSNHKFLVLKNLLAASYGVIIPDDKILHIPKKHPKIDEITSSIRGIDIVTQEKISSLTHKDYTGPKQLDNWIKYSVDYPEDWQPLISIAQYLITSKAVPTSEVDAWSRYFMNLLYIKKNAKGGIEYLGGYAPIFDGIPPEHITKMAQPPSPQGLKSVDWNTEPANWTGYGDLKALDVNNAPYVLPIIFGHINRRNMCASGSNFINRMTRISDIINIYEEAPFNFSFCSPHWIKNLTTEDKGSNSAQNSIDKDILAKLLKCKILPDIEVFNRVITPLIIQNTTFFGLSNYTCFGAILKYVGNDRLYDVLGALNHKEHSQEAARFFHLLNFAHKFSKDHVWYSMKALDASFYHDWSPKQNPLFMMNVAYLCEIVTNDPKNKPYTSLLALKNSRYIPLRPDRMLFLKDVERILMANRPKADAGSLLPPLLTEESPAGDDQAPETMPED